MMLSLTAARLDSLIWLQSSFQTNLNFDLFVDVVFASFKQDKQMSIPVPLHLR